MADNIVAVEAVDDHTVVFTLAEPDGSFLTKLSVPAFGVTERAVVEAHGGVASEDAARTDRAQAWLDHNSAGSGPYVLAEYVPEERVVLVRNPNYWGEPAAVERVVITVVADPNMQALLLQNGDVDMALSLTADQLPLLQRARRRRSVHRRNADHPLLDDERRPGHRRPHGRREGAGRGARRHRLRQL